MSREKKVTEWQCGKSCFVEHGYDTYTLLSLLHSLQSEQVIV